MVKNGKHRKNSNGQKGNNSRSSNNSSNNKQECSEPPPNPKSVKVQVNSTNFTRTPKPQQDGGNKNKNKNNSAEVCEPKSNESRPEARMPQGTKQGQVEIKCCYTKAAPPANGYAPKTNNQPAADNQTRTQQTQTKAETGLPVSRKPGRNAQIQTDQCGSLSSIKGKPNVKCTVKNKCEAFNEQEHPLSMRYRAVLVDAKPTLININISGIVDPQKNPPKKKTKSQGVQASKKPSRNSACVGPTEAGDIDDEFRRMKEDKLAIIWIIGYTQASVTENKKRCLRILKESNNLGIVNVEQELQNWHDNKKKFSKPPDDIRDKVLYEGKRLADKVILKKMPLTSVEVCQALKLALVGSHLKDNSLRGFFLDNFPINIIEGEDSEEFLTPSVVCLYFESKTWTDNKTVQPNTIKPKLKFRPGSYSESAAEAAADHFGYKTIKILNAEELEDIQIHDIDQLVKKHLEGHGLELHKIAKHIHRHRSSNPDGTSRTVTEFASKVVVDHTNFVDKKGKKSDELNLVTEVKKEIKKTSEPKRGGSTAPAPPAPSPAPSPSPAPAPSSPVTNAPKNTEPPKVSYADDVKTEQKSNFPKNTPVKPGVIRSPNDPKTQPVTPRNKNDPTVSKSTGLTSSYYESSLGDTSVTTKRKPVVVPNKK